MENRFRAAGSGEPDINYTHIYPNWCFFSTKIEDSGGGDWLEYMKNLESTDIQKYHKNFPTIKSADMLEI
jgi:hypothetical protein